MSASTRIIDCFGTGYQIVRMPGSGFCGFHSLSHSLTGNVLAYQDIIHDCINTFTNIPELFTLRTNFGAHNESLRDYTAFMQDAIRDVQQGRPVDSLAWCEEAHLIAIALLYDIMIFTYDRENKQWFVVNESGSRYICLLSLPGHFDVLIANDAHSPPVIPAAANTCGVTRGTYEKSDGVWESLQSSYSFEFVYPIPPEFAGIDIFNRPLSATTNVPNDRLSAEPGIDILHHCDFPQCSYVSSNLNGIKMHKVRRHNKKMSNRTAGIEHEQVSQTGVDVTDRTENFACFTSNSDINAANSSIVSSIKNECIKPVLSYADVVRRTWHNCDSTGCTYTSNRLKAITTHKRHCVRSSSKSACHIQQKTAKMLVNECEKSVSHKGRNEINVQLKASSNSRKANSDDHSYIIGSRKSERMARRPAPSYTDGIRRTTSKTESDKACVARHKIVDVEPDSTAETDSDVSSSISEMSLSSQSHAKTKNMRCVRSEIGRFLCDIVGCGAQFDTPKDLFVHKDKRHLKRTPADDTTAVQSDSDNVSVASVDSCSLRRSSRIRNSKRQRIADNFNSELTQPKQREVRVSMVTNAADKANVERTGKVEQTSNANKSSNNWREKLDHTKKKQHVKTSFSATINEFEKNFSQAQNKHEQNDPLYDKLKNYHDTLLVSVTNTTTEKLSAEVLKVIKNPAMVDDGQRQFRWSKQDEIRLNDLNKTCKSLQSRSDWTWSAADNSLQGEYNDKRMQLCITHECQWKLIECDECQSIGLLVGDQTESSICYDCLQLSRQSDRVRNEKQAAWKKVRPITKDFPRTPDGQDLPYLQPGEKSVLAPVLPVVTVTKNVYAEKRLRRESISIIRDPMPTWCKFLPRTSLVDRFLLIERRVKDSVKYIVANADRVRKWLRFLFKNHTEFIRLSQQNQLAIDEAAIDTLGPDLELAEVDSSLAEHTTEQSQQIEEEIRREDDGITDATVSSGLSETHVFSFDKYEPLYLKSKDVIRIRKEGKVEIVKDDTVRKPTYSSSANLAFPYLYPYGQKSPLDFEDNKLARWLLKKQALYAHRMRDGRLQWTFAEDDIHMMHQHSRLCEQTVRSKVGYYLSSHPSVAHVPLNSIITAFRDGVDKDSGLLDSHLPDLTTVMSQLPNSRQKWFSERLGIEAVSRDNGSPNIFVTINLDPRASPDVRRLIYRLEHGKEMARDEPFERNTAEFTRLLSKYAPLVAIYLYRKVKIMMHVFFTKICRIPEIEPKCDWTQQDITETGWYWGRVEFTETRGVPHYHFLAKLPNVLDTGIVGRIIHNGRVVRNELKCGNIKPEQREEAWRMIEMGLLANRYAAHFAHSISTASFYSEDVGIDGHQADKVIHLGDYRKEYVKNYKEGNINLKTHPILRRFDDHECHENQFHEMADIASVSCLHQCIRASCGGDPLSGDGCRFDFPKKELKHTVVAVMQVNPNQMEPRVLLRRTCDRVSNSSRYLIRYFRSNHDVSVLIDTAHKIRYATKYCTKSGKHAQLLDEMIEHLNKRSTDLLPPNMKQVLSHLLLADCSHRAFISKQELAYKVMILPDILKSFPDVGVVGFYNRANLQVPYDDEHTIEYSDRTEYSAYAERCRDDTELGRGLTEEAVSNMCLNEFAQRIQHKWINSKKAESKVIDEVTKRKFRTRDVNTGHWRLTLCNRRKHIRPSTVLHTAPAIDYEYVEHGKTTTQTTFFDLPIEKRHQLYRAYYELVMYIPWNNTPDETFLSANVRSIIDNKETHAEIDSRHSLQRLEEFWKVYNKFYNDGKVAPPGSCWQKDNQFSYSMFLVNQHNRDIHLDRVDNKGMLKAQYEDVEELQNVDVDIRPTDNDVTDESEYPTFQNFMPPDMYRDIVEQKPMNLAEISVAFPLHHQWQRLEEVVTHNKAKRFIANPPPSPVDYDDMTPIQKFAVDRGKDESQQILCLFGGAGCGKSAVALKICEHFAGRVQATAYTGKAASIFNGPTIHSMFGWSHNQHSSASTDIKPDSTKVQKFAIDHEDVVLFVFEEILNIPPAYLAMIDDFMTAAFNPKHRKNSLNELPPFGGKKVLVLGDQAQLPPIGGPALYDDGRTTVNTQSKRQESKQSKRTKKGQLIFEKYLVPNCIYLQRGQRNTGLLGEICERMRNGVLSVDDFTMLSYQRARFPDVCTDFGIHYQNEMCSMHNWRQLWNECSLSTPPRRMFICKATYHVTSDNDQIVDALSTLPPQAYDYAPDILCVAEGCEVRLLHNVNIAAGLVTSQSGTVVKVVYNNADVNSLLAGEHVVPYCIVVSIAGFQGFVAKRDSSGRRIFPFPNQPTWVPIFRKRFGVKISFLPTWIRKKQSQKDCFRIQFPIDLASNITAHRAQGQTMADCLVSVDLGLQNPDMRMPPEIGSLLYVACTRVTKLENLFVSPIHPSLWQKIGQTDIDKYRRTVDVKLRHAAEKFAANHGLYKEMRDELRWTAKCSNNAEEWRLLQQQRDPPPSMKRLAGTADMTKDDTDFYVELGDTKFAMFGTAVLSERHIGIDQGVNNFAIAVVERKMGENPNIVEAKNYTNLELKKRFKATDVLVELTDKTDLLAWMEPVNNDHMVDRVIVHLEQMDARNKNSKQFSVELGKLLQQQASDSQTCVVKMSQPHIHRATGPLFHLGDEIVETLQLQPSLYLQRRSRAESNPSGASVQSGDAESEPFDVEPSDDATVNRMRQSEAHEYRAKKKMSGEVFRYVIDANEQQLQQMKLTIDENVQGYWREKIASQSSVKVDDAGDALLHALDELLCGSTNYKQLVPAAPSVHVNRTVVLAIFPENTYWIALNCRWNAFVFENFGCLSSGLRNCYYKHPSTVDTIKTNMTKSKDVWSSLSQFDGDTTYDAVDHIKVVVKQLTGHTDLGLSNEQAGALTDSTTKAMKLICDDVIGTNSKLFERRDRVLGSMYSRTSTVNQNRKFQVINSTGKHTNAVLSCLSWMKHNLTDFVVNRREILSEHEKRTFFHAILNLAHSDTTSMEMLQLSDTVKTKLRSDEFTVTMRNDNTYTRNIADLILVGLSKNQQHVKAVAANSRKTSKSTK